MSSSSYEITARIEWDMAHRLPSHRGKCQNLHGHRYATEVTCRAPELTDQGFVVDVGLLKSLIGTWVYEQWDHNACFGVEDKLMRRMSELQVADGGKAFHELPGPPTAERLAEHLFKIATSLLEVGAPEVEVVDVVVWETPSCRARYRPEPELEYNPDVMEPPSFADPSIQNLKKLLEKKATPSPYDLEAVHRHMRKDR